MRRYLFNLCTNEPFILGIEFVLNSFPFRFFLFPSNNPFFLSRWPCEACICDVCLPELVGKSEGKTESIKPTPVRRNSREFGIPKQTTPSPDFFTPDSFVFYLSQDSCSLVFSSHGVHASRRMPASYPSILTPTDHSRPQPRFSLTASPSPPALNSFFTLPSQPSQYAPFRVDIAIAIR